MALDGGPSGHLKPRGWLASELGARVISSVVLALFALALTTLGGWSFALLWLAAAAAVILEWLAMVRAEPLKPLQVAASLGLAATSVALLVSGSAAAAIAAGLSLAGLAALTHSARSRLWAVGGFLYALAIALVPPAVRDDAALGIPAVLWMFAVVWATDVAAYFTGRALGGPKLWPAVSPKKTWSGFWGGLAAGIAAGLLVDAAARGQGWVSPLSVPALAGLSAVASVLSQLGDLAESAMKRKNNVKDSGYLIPGHGGVMDRLDGFWSVSALVGALLLLRSVV